LFKFTEANITLKFDIIYHIIIIILGSLSS